MDVYGVSGNACTVFLFVGADAHICPHRPQHNRNGGKIMETIKALTEFYTNYDEEGRLL